MYGASSTEEASHVIKSSPGILNSVYMTGPTSGYLMAFNATSAPSDGTVTPVICVTVSALGLTGINFDNYPAYFSNGIAVVYSTTGPFTKTASAAAYFQWEFE